MAKKNAPAAVDVKPADNQEAKSSDDLKVYLSNLRDKLAEEGAAPIYVLAAVNSVLNLPNVYDLLSSENKELLRDVWLRLRQAGIQVKSPPALFSPEEIAAEKISVASA